MSIMPAFDLLPPWEDREMLRRFMTEEGLQLLVPVRGSPEFNSALGLLGGARPACSDPAYFLVCCSDSSGSVLAAMDCCTAGNTLLMLRSRVSKRVEKMQLHLLLYGAALAKARPESVFCTAPRSSLSPELAGKLIFLGRGLGMSAIPANHWILFIRRMGRESDPITDGGEVAASLRSLRKFFDNGIDAVISEVERKGMLPLVQLPNSPDRPEHLHELKEAVLALGLPVNGLESVLDTIRLIYVEDRHDITPDAL